MGVEPAGDAGHQRRETAEAARPTTTPKAKLKHQQGRRQTRQPQPCRQQHRAGEHHRARATGPDKLPQATLPSAIAMKASVMAVEMPVGTSRCPAQWAQQHRQRKQPANGDAAEQAAGGPR